jgi:hypothetical protein
MFVLFETLVTTILKMFLGIFYSLDWFQSYSHVPMKYYECCYISKFNSFKTNLDYHFKLWNIKKWFQLF